MAVFTAAQAQREQHIEPYWHGLYGVAGYNFATNVNTTAYSDKATFHGFYAVGGWQIRKESGVGLGVEFLKDASGAFTHLPVFVELRTHYLRSQLTPYSTVYIGYAIPLGATSGGDNAVKINQGGPLWGVNIGARYAFNRNLAVAAYVGYMGERFGHVGRWVDGSLAIDRPLLLQNIKAGVSLNYYIKH